MSPITRFIFRNFRLFAKWILFQIIVSAILALSFFVRPYLFKVLLDTIVELPSSESLAPIYGPLVLTILLELLFMVIEQLPYVGQIYMVAPLEKKLGEGLMRQLMQYPYEVYQRFQSGKMASHIRDAISLTPSLLFMASGKLVQHVLTFVIIFGGLYRLYAPLAWGLLFWVLGSLLLILIFIRRLGKLSGVSARESGFLMGHIVDIFTNMFTIRLFAKKDAEKKRIQPLLTSYQKALETQQNYSSTLLLFQGLGYILYQALSLYLLTKIYIAGNMTAGDFSLVMLMNFRLSGVFFELSRLLSRFVEDLGSAYQGFKAVFAPLDFFSLEEKKGIDAVVGNIVVEEVSFSYPTGKALFENLSVVIPAGQKVGVVGSSGSGKSTFLHLIMGLFKTSSGKILLDGEDIKHIEATSFYSNITMLPQEPVLFHRSILENIRYGHLTASDEEVRSAARKAFLHDFIMGLPAGYDTVVGEQGLKLSGGQRQLVSLARAFLRDTPILMLDEATSQLDAVTEIKIQEHLEAFMAKKTVVMVAHRLATLQRVDRILVLEEGKIVEDGTHEALLSAGHIYTKLWERQVSGFAMEKKQFDDGEQT